ncbi:MAG: diguanylate cyclase, partial [Oscillospiraceae bacterium]|nr:diguanylate cyclase [Oscillospiraceae bacterium]
MHKYIIKRLLYSALIFFFVMLVIYIILRCLPTSYLENVARQMSQRPGSKTYQEWLAQLEAQYGMDKGYLAG